MQRVWLGFLVMLMMPALIAGLTGEQVGSVVR